MSGKVYSCLHIEPLWKAVQENNIGCLGMGARGKPFNVYAFVPLEFRNFQVNEIKGRSEEHLGFSDKK